MPDEVADPAAWLHRLGNELMSGRYRPAPVRWVELPAEQPGKRTRTIGILTLRDRVVHTALRQVLEPILEPTFAPISFAFRPGYSIYAALEQVRRCLRYPAEAPPRFRFAAHWDVHHCFDSLDHQMLCQRLAEFIADEDVLNLLEAILQSMARTAGWFGWRRQVGVVQGSPLSPLLCNLYLDPLDRVVLKLKRDTHGRVCGLRYADDLLLFAADRSSARRARRDLSRAARGLKLRFHYNDGCFQRLERGVHWLGVCIRPSSYRWNGLVEFHYEVPDEKVRHMLEVISDMTEPPSERINRDAFHPARWIVSLNQQLRQWYQAYRFAANGPAVFNALDEHARRRLATLLQRLTGLRRPQVFQTYAVRLPRGFWSWQVDGVRLATLAALAPRRPEKLVRPAPWRKPPATNTDKKQGQKTTATLATVATGPKQHAVTTP